MFQNHTKELDVVFVPHVPTMPEVSRCSSEYRY
jgi:hypothetical protein